MNFGTIADVARATAQRLEETWPPVFWTQEELYNGAAEAMMEATLMTGEPEERRGKAITLVADQPFYDNPPEAVVVVRLESTLGTELKRVSVWDLDAMIPEWQTETGSQIKYWFPFGLTRFGVYPRLTSAIQVVPTYVKLPVAVPRPYSGAEIIPFQEEFLHALESYSAHVNRLKSGGVEFQQSMELYNDFTDAMKAMGKFADRKGSIRFTRRGGITAEVTGRKD